MYCKHCGHELNEDNICTNPDCPSKLNTENNFENNNSNMNQQYYRAENGISTSEMIAFVGEKKADYYLSKWDDYQNNENFVSWNWPAFLCGFYWFWYRKMYSIMAIILGVSICGVIILPDWARSILSIGITIGCGLFANQLYMKHATRRITSLKSLLQRGVDYDVVMRRIRNNGGTTIVPIIVSIVLFVVIALALILLAAVGMSIMDQGTIPLY